MTTDSQFFTCVYMLSILLNVKATIPIVINTWNFSEATVTAWETLESGGTVIDALVSGCSKCEQLQCDGTVGYGGSPDENGESTLDALIFDGLTMDMGAVGGIRRIKDAMAVAKHVFEKTEHSILVGDLATKFAVRMGFKEESLSTNKSIKMYKEWINKKCQPNFWKNVKPNPHKYCGPYNPGKSFDFKNDPKFSKKNHDTIGMIAINADGHIAAGTSTNGANHKIPGRVGDSPIPGAGAYADNGVGAAVATGDGDIMMRFLPSFLAVEEMRRGETPASAAQLAVHRIRIKYPDFFGGVIAVSANGEYAAACNGMKSFPYCVRSAENGGIRIEYKDCT